MKTSAARPWARATTSVRMHAAVCAGPTSTSGGSAASHSATCSGQRGPNGQPGGRFTSDGGEPRMGVSRSRVELSSRGRDPSSPSV